nr:nuclear transport factor 2 family protein [uncultured Nocardioides sp.]
MSDVDEIRTLIQRWAEAVHRGDLDAVVKDHADDIVMFDVPPPHRGVRGLDGYRATWPDFFELQRSGALFEIAELEVIAGNDVGFAYALLRCGRPTEDDPGVEPRLRLSLGLRRNGDRWEVAHEHHSFADTSVSPESAAQGAHVH